MTYLLKRRIDLRLIFLYVTAAAISFGWVFSQAVTFNSDSITFLHYANWLTGQAEISPFWYLRTPGFPLLLILSGVTKFNDFFGFMLIQSVISMGIIYCIYNIVKITQPKYALLISWISIATCVPFIFSTMVTCEHANIFCYLWLIYSLIALAHRKNHKYIYYAAVANICIFLLKPSNYYVFFLSISYISVFSRQSRFYNIFRFIAVYGVVMLLYIGGFGLLKLSHPGLEGLSSVFQGIRAVSSQVYQEQQFKAEYGASNTKLLQAVREYYPDKKLFIFQESNGENYNLMTDALSRKYGYGPGGEILVTATIESYFANPAIFLRWINNIFNSSSNNYTGQMLFYPLMLKSPYVVDNESGGKDVKIAASNGAATAEMLQHLRNYIIKREYIWSQWSPRESFANFAGRPDDLIANIFQNPTHVYHSFIWQALDREIGPTVTSKLFLAAALEGYRAHPKAMMCFLDDLVSYFFGLDVTYKSGNRIMFMPNPGLGETASSPHLSSTMLDQMHYPILNVQTNIWKDIYNVYSYVWLLTKIFIFVMALMGVIMVIDNKLLPGFLLMWSLIMYNALITSVFADPFFRYSALTWLLTAIVALQAICYLIEKREVVFNNKTIKPTIALENS